MNKLPIILLAFVFAAEISKPSTMSGICLTAGVMLSETADIEVVKYKRKDCPICKGKGWYISGDGIAKVDCGYCEPEKEEPTDTQPEQPTQLTEPEECCKTEIIKE
jgi:hypothetical protein